MSYNNTVIHFLITYNNTVIHVLMIYTTIQSFMFVWNTKNYNQRSTHDILAKRKRTKEHAMN
jgi:hypothetical protein